jgi:hypothetical protein
MSSKTIEINPSLFGIGKKNRSKRNKSMSVPLISPNILKNKLLKRIKDHKKKETENFDKGKKDFSESKTGESFSKNTSTYTDEFNDSIEYLQTLSKQKKVDSENSIKKEAIQRKTVKNYSSMPAVNLELPEELKETFINIDTETIQTNNMLPSHIVPNYKSNDVPYGILKGGNKQTYRQWNRTQKNYQPVSNNLITNAPVSEREGRLNLLKQKLKQQSTIVNQPVQNSLPVQNLLPVQNSLPLQVVSQPVLMPTQMVNQPNLEEILLTHNLIQKPKQEIIINTQNESKSSIVNSGGGGEPEKIRTTKKLLKKTIHKKYTLGKSKIKKTVAVLLKDKNTRKNVINAQKDLRDKSVSDVKTYLRKHNLIKIGSNAPNDVIRKIYESAMLAGEITNNNKETMIHNFIKDDN